MIEFSIDDLRYIVSVSQPERVLMAGEISKILPPLNANAEKLVYALRTYMAKDAPKIVIDMNSVSKKVEQLNDRLFRSHTTPTQPEIQALFDEFESGGRRSLLALAWEVGKHDVDVGLNHIINLTLALDEIAAAARRVSHRHSNPDKTLDISRYPSAAWFGIAVTQLFATELNLKIGSSRESGASPHPGRPGGPMVRLLRALFERLRCNLRTESDSALLLANSTLSPTDDTLSRWIGRAKPASSSSG